MGKRIHRFLVAAAFTAALLTVATGLVKSGSFFGYKNYVVSQDGMYPSILRGEQILVDLKAYSSVSDVQRGDIVVFEYPVDPSLDFVYRVIGMPRDTISVRGRQIFVNGERLRHTVLSRAEGAEMVEESIGSRTYAVVFTAGSDQKAEVQNWIVGDNSLYVLGDNRDRALDSRSWGEVPFEKVRGKAVRIYLPKRLGRLFRKL